MHHTSTSPGPDPADTFTASDGRRFLLRPIRATDADALVRAFARLTPEQIRLRVFHRLGALSPEVATRLANPDPAWAAAWVAIDSDEEIRGDARYYADRAGKRAEFGVIVDPSVTGLGLGRALLQCLLDDARARGLEELWGAVLTENATMLELAQQLGAVRGAMEGEPGVVRVGFKLGTGGTT
ncbi:MAG: GNAT family N-acetyltransferase [Xanthomonadales bacterium]|nr:GNAT family N-acetyltransferase [Xanthomonadales bacterium]